MRRTQNNQMPNDDDDTKARSVQLDSIKLKCYYQLSGVSHPDDVPQSDRLERLLRRLMN